MIGIYKITSPSKKVYIGQSIDINIRFSRYKKLECKAQPAIYNSLKKYGFEKHKFEILCECDVKELNDKERYYQDVFSSTGVNGLNCKLTRSSDRSGKHSKETIFKMIESKKYISDETRRKISESAKLRCIKNNNLLGRNNKGRTHSDEFKENCRKINLGRKQSEEIKIKKSKIILNTQTGIFYFGYREAAIIANINENTFNNYLIGKTKNKTSFIYV